MKSVKFNTRPGADWVCSSCRQQQLPRQSQRRRPHITIRLQSNSAPSRKTSQKLPDYPARTRFAPSPTGFLHLGSLRTALFNFLLARATKGQFLLRIEDTDTKRTVPGALERICRDLEWAGLHWDEGPEVGGLYGPYLQSGRTQIYREHADKLLKNGRAYRCFCTAERLNELAEARSKMGLPTDYDRTCAGMTKDESDDRAHKGEKFTVRFKVPTVYPEYFDLVYGRVGGNSEKHNKRLQRRADPVFEDPILLKSDGFPTYHLANVVDDHLMNITHVIRGVEWMTSTPKHLSLYKAFGWEAPNFAHVGLLQDREGQKLSKRNADIDIASYQKQGYFPEAIANFCALLGWSHNRGNDVMNMKELVESFDLKFTKGNMVVGFNKLSFLQEKHALQYVQERGAMFEQIVDQLLTLLNRRVEEDKTWGLPDGTDARKYISAVLTADAKFYRTPDKFLDSNFSFFTSPFERADERPELDEETVEVLRGKLGGVPEGSWSGEKLKALIEEVIAAHNERRGLLGTREEVKKAALEVNKWLRWAVLSSRGPPMWQTMEILGKKTTLARLNSEDSPPT